MITCHWNSTSFCYCFLGNIAKKKKGKFLVRIQNTVHPVSKPGEGREVKRWLCGPVYYRRKNQVLTQTEGKPTQLWELVKTTKKLPSASLYLLHACSVPSTWQIHAIAHSLALQLYSPHLNLISRLGKSTPIFSAMVPLRNGQHCLEIKPHEQSPVEACEDVPAVDSSDHQVSLWPHNHCENIQGPGESHPAREAGRNQNQYENAIGADGQRNSRIKWWGKSK